MLSYVELL